MNNEANTHVVQRSYKKIVNITRFIYIEERIPSR